MRLIDADALRASAMQTTETNEVSFNNCFPYWQFSKCINEAPIINAVPVVRCGECRWFADNNGGNWFGCQMFNAIRLVPEDTPKENDYCSYGEKMESEGGA